MAHVLKRERRAQAPFRTAGLQQSAVKAFLFQSSSNHQTQTKEFGFSESLVFVFFFLQITLKYLQSRTPGSCPSLFPFDN
uniref:Uncharacterized protein n=1 Tax=Anguilla anguilla TaxID=7936 RepID=A0A0E9WSJ5_ANGAN